jgi:hypothetical protein
MRKFVGMVGGVKVDGGGTSLSWEGGSAMATGVAGAAGCAGKRVAWESPKNLVGDGSSVSEDRRPKSVPRDCCQVEFARTLCSLQLFTSALHLLARLQPVPSLHLAG